MPYRYHMASFQDHALCSSDDEERSYSRAFRASFQHDFACAGDDCVRARRLASRVHSVAATQSHERSIGERNGSHEEGSSGEQGRQGREEGQEVGFTTSSSTPQAL